MMAVGRGVANLTPSRPPSLPPSHPRSSTHPPTPPTPTKTHLAARIRRLPRRQRPRVLRVVPLPQRHLQLVVHGAPRALRRLPVAQRGRRLRGRGLALQPLRGNLLRAGRAGRGSERE